MELLYVWIEDYNNIHHQGFNFSPKHRFHFEPNEKEGPVTGGTLTHDDINPNYPDNFFGEHISNITAIVGKNGSGKSSLLLKLFELNKAEDYYNSFAVFIDRNVYKIKCPHNIRLDVDVKFDYEDYKSDIDLLYSNTTISDAFQKLNPFSRHKIFFGGAILTPDADIVETTPKEQRLNGELVFRDYKCWKTWKQIETLVSTRGKNDAQIPIPSKIKVYWDKMDSEEIESMEHALSKDGFTKSSKEEYHNAFVYEIGENYGDNIDQLEKFWLCLNSQIDLNLIPFQQKYDKLLLSWEGLSSGEEAFLDLVISTTAQRVLTTNHPTHCKCSIILLDEPDTSMHPSWQKQIISNCIRFALPNVQYIITSHSPIMISDLPRENIIFLDKDIKGNCVVKEPIDMDRTFGANIHSLYRSSFFMDGVMGKFAEEKIQEVLDCLNGTDQVDEVKKKKVRFIIDQIGEPLIREMLLKKYDMKFHFSVEDRIEALEKEIVALKAKRDDTN